eukprot:m.62220 g.62220  ORF g.62220 m.62220 type:complete len:299 (-) comp12391_c2_seq2:1424-2320(-)
MASDEAFTDVAPAPQPSPMCGICLEAPSVYLVKACGHGMCDECAKTLLVIHWRDPIVHCPECPLALTEAEIKEITPKDKYEKRARQLRLDGDSSLRACPRCYHVFPPANDALEESLTCPKCAAVFCGFHNTIHPNQVCPGHGSGPQGSSALFKPCPHCNTPIEHAGGCDHVICTRCQKDFCFRCGQANLTGTFVRKCQTCNSAYIHHRYLSLWLLGWILLLPLWLILFTLVGIVFLVTELYLMLRLRCEVARRIAPEFLFCCLCPCAFLREILAAMCHCTWCACYQSHFQPPDAANHA